MSEEQERERKGKGTEEGKDKKRKGKEGKGKRKEQRKRKVKNNKKVKKERKRKKKSKGREMERKRGKKYAVPQCLTRTIFNAKSYRFAIVRASCVYSCFSGKGCNHQTIAVVNTYQAPSLCRIWHAFVGVPLRLDNERKIPKAVNSCRTMDRSRMNSRTLDFKSLDTDHFQKTVLRSRCFSHGALGDHGKQIGACFF